MYEFTPHIERQINNQINQLFDLHNQTTSYITTKFEAIDKTLENLELSIEKLSENFAVTTSLNTRLNQIENSLERINGFINGLGNSLPRQFLQTYMLCKEEINDVKNASLAAIEDVKTSIVKDVKQSISLFTPQLLAISNNLMHECIVTSESYKDVMQGINIEKHINVPLIAHGGCGSEEDINALFKLDICSLGIGSLVVYSKKDKGVLINMPNRFNV
jgi:fructose/tagatose bisphosphate aldolase